ncbi:hypothetical protein BCY90_17750 [Agrobacterium deltaense]|nr:hypothetical protein L901_19515 [Agrobacterium sp. D14]RKF41222.1 hypothetical protein BCY90_17750 [Agrobacterium deltaense]
MLSAETRRKIAVICLYKPNLLGHSRFYWGKELQCKGILSAAEEICDRRAFPGSKGQATREEINGY